ncbi:alkyl sulfatase C-terminal domain-containing protein [Streptomyces roseirectus]|uniref:alkyl sulfatase C-terminal domain-containing protein n=1 Tax=Streptomyces roseirectus TaxID=2768066 RepID=UPI001FECB370|nr:alkyl sulfatase C-terminal domain-containing protein [Streptomyces roseirectus]
MAVPDGPLNGVLARTTTFLDEITAGRVTLDGDATVLATLGGLLEAPDPDFALVTP